MAWEATTQITDDIPLVQGFIPREEEALYFKGGSDQGLIISRYDQSKKEQSIIVFGLDRNSHIQVRAYLTFY